MYIYRSENTWEPEENLDCPGLIRAFEDVRKKKEMKDSERETKRKRTDKKNRVEEIEKPRGYERELELQKIVGSADDKSGTLMFLVKWYGSDELDLLPASEVNEKNPEVVIAFYEARSKLIQKLAERNITAEPPVHEQHLADDPPPAAEEEQVVEGEVERVESVEEQNQPGPMDQDMTEPTAEEMNKDLSNLVHESMELLQ